MFDTSTTAGLRCWAALVVYKLQVDRGGARPEHVRGRLQQRSRLGVTVGRPPNGVAVDPEGDVVEEEAAVHLGHVDPALDPVGERVERADQIAPVDAEVEREVVPGAGGDADEREPVRESGCGHDGERSVAAGEPVRSGARQWATRRAAAAWQPPRDPPSDPTRQETR